MKSFPFGLFILVSAFLLSSCRQSDKRLDAFFTEYSTSEGGDWIGWIEKSQIVIPIIEEDFWEYEDLPKSFFCAGHIVSGYMNTWELHLLRRIDSVTITHSVIIPVYRSEILSETDCVDHFGDHITEQESLLSKILNQIPLKPVNADIYPIVECRVSDDFGYTGLFDTVRGLAYVITLGEYALE